MGAECEVRQSPASADEHPRRHPHAWERDAAGKPLTRARRITLPGSQGKMPGLTDAGAHLHSRARLPVQTSYLVSKTPESLFLPRVGPAFRMVAAPVPNGHP